MGANRGVSGVEDVDVEIGESEGEGVVGGGSLVVRRLVGRLGRVDRGCIVVVVGEDVGDGWLEAEGRAVCRLVWVCESVVGGLWWMGR